MRMTNTLAYSNVILLLISRGSLKVNEDDKHSSLLQRYTMLINRGSVKVNENDKHTSLQQRYTTVQ